MRSLTVPSVRPKLAQDGVHLLLDARHLAQADLRESRRRSDSSSYDACRKCAYARRRLRAATGRHRSADRGTSDVEERDRLLPCGIDMRSRRCARPAPRAPRARRRAALDRRRRARSNDVTNGFWAGGVSTKRRICAIVETQDEPRRNQILGRERWRASAIASRHPVPDLPEPRHVVRRVLRRPQRMRTVSVVGRGRRSRRRTDRAGRRSRRIARSRRTTADDNGAASAESRCGVTHAAPIESCEIARPRLM